jgi:tetratricopeptide (TPR) repeat protein
MNLPAFRCLHANYGLFLLLVALITVLLWSSATIAWAQQVKLPEKVNSLRPLEDMIPSIGAGEIKVGLIRKITPVCDKVEKGMKDYLDRLKLDHVIEVETVWEVLPKLAEVSNQAGKKIKYLVLAGHGDPNPNQPGFGIGTIAFGPTQIDFALFEAKCLEEQRKRDEKVKELCGFLKSTDPIERKIDGIVGASSLAIKEKDLKKEIEKRSENVREWWTKYITPIHNAQGVMADDGVIVFLNCYSGIQGHRPFVNDLSALLFGGKNGNMYVSNKAMKIGEDYSGNVILDNPQFYRIPSPVSKPRMISQTLPVFLVPTCISAREGAKAQIKSDVATLGDSGTIIYNWQGCVNNNAADCLVDTSGKKDLLIEGKVVVKDELDRTGEGNFCIFIDLNIEIQLSPDIPVEDSEAAATAHVKSGLEPQDSYYHWTASGAVTILGEKDTQNVKIKIAGDGKLTVRLIWSGPSGKLHDLAIGSLNIKPKKVVKKDDSKPPGDQSGTKPPGDAADEKSGDKKSGDKKPEKPIEKEKAEKEKTEKEKAEEEKAGKEKGEPSGKLSFSGTAADIWEGGNTPEGFSLKRRNAKGGRTFDLCPYPGEVWAEAWGKFEPSRSLRTREDMARRLNEEVEDHKRWGREGVIREIAVGDFKGLFLDTKVRFYYGAWAADAGFRACEIKAFGHGFVMKGERVVELGYYVSGAGCFDNSHRPFLESQGATAQSEAKAIMAGLRLVESGVISKVSYTGPKLDGSDLPQVVLVPSQIERLKVGDVVKVQAVVEKAKPEDSPFNYTWTGDFQGSGNAVTLKAAKPGKFTLTVSVDGARYNLGSASVEYEVADFKVKIERMPAGNQPVPVGGKVHLKATLTSDGRPASGDFIYRWQPHPEVSFLPFEGSSTDTDAVFTKLEKTKVWVQVLEQKGKILSTVAESDQIEIDVIQPKLKLVAEPTDPYVGKEVKVTVTEEPRMDDKTIDFWWEIAGNALNPGPLKDNRQYTFRPKDTRPITVTVHAKAKDGGADLGEERIAVTGKPYQVTARTIEKFPKPKVFDPARKGFVEVPRGTFVTDEQVTVEAEVIGGPPRDETRWNWVGNEGTSVSNPASSSPAVSRHEIGTAQATVTARDKDNVVLGSTTVSFSVTVSADEGKASASKEVAKKLSEARQLLSEGKIDRAITVAEEAAKLDPKAAEPLLKELAQASKKWGWDAVNDREFDKAVKGLENAVRLDPSDKDAQEKLRKAKGWSDVWDRIVNQEVPEFDRLISEKKPFSAQKQLLKIQEMQKDMPGGGSSKVLQGITERFNRAMEEYRAFRQDVEKRYTEYFKEKNWEAGQSLMQESLIRELHVTDEKTNRERLAQCQQMLGEQRQVWDFYQRTKIDFEQGKVKDATKVVQELRDKTNVYGNNAPQRQQMLDLAKGIEKKFAEDREKTKAAMDAKKKSEDLLARGIEMQEQKRHEEGIASFTQAIELDPNNSEAYRRRGMSKRETKDYSGAMADFTRAIDLDPQNSRAYAGRGGTRAGMDDVRGAIDDYTRAIELDSQYESAYFNRGFYRGKQGDHTGAVADYDHVIGINPKNSEAYNNRGSAKENLGDLRGALSDYEQALAINGSYERARRNAERVRALLAGGKADTGTETGKSKDEGAVIGTVPSSNILTSKVWQFGRSDATVLASKMRLLPGGQIEGATHSNESRWAIVGKELLFYDSAGKVSTRYNSFRQEGGRWVISGPFVLWGKITHVLKEVGDLAPPVISKGSDLSGTWKSTYTADQYEITQSGAQFTWVRKGTSETAKGTVDGNRLSVTWTGGPVGTGSATATVIVDASGRATEIRFSNGAVFIRVR